MLLVRTTLRESPVSGIGLFADEPIPKGTLIWKFDPTFDLIFDPKAVDALPSLQRELIVCYAYLSIQIGTYIYSIDDSRFINHSADHANIDEVARPGERLTCGVANRDIARGEEILENYRSYDAHDRVSDAPYLGGGGSP